MQMKTALLAPLMALAALPALAEKVAEVGVDWVGNDIVVESFHDPKVEGVTCHLAYFSRSVIDRLSQGISNAMESSSAHLDLISDLRWINTQVASIGYDVLPASESSGDAAAEQLISHPE